MSSLDFGSMIGSPLVAVINAQSQASMATVKFIKEVGFAGEQAATLPFRYQRAQLREDGTMTTQGFELSVPLLSLVPVPCLRIRETHIEFNAKVVSIRSRSNKNESESQGAGKERREHSELQVAFSNRQHSTRGEQQSRSYSMNVKVIAVQEELPEGLERLLSRLEGAALERPMDDPAK